MTIPKNLIEYRIVCLAGYQGSRPAVTQQANVKTFANCNEKCSQPQNLSNKAKKNTKLS